MRLLILSLSLLSCTHITTATAQPSAQQNRLHEEWVAGTHLSQDEFTKSGGEESYFVAMVIDEAIFSRIDGLSYGNNCTVPLSDLRYLKLLHYNANDQITLGEVICSREISDDLLSIFKELFRAEYKIESLKLIDEYGANDHQSMINNNSSSFNFRYIAGTTKLSKHSLGLAIDINPLYNPYVRGSGEDQIIDPIEAKEYVDRSRDFPYKIDKDDLCYNLFIEHGFTWGGDWSSLKDYQHFEK